MREGQSLHLLVILHPSLCPAPPHPHHASSLPTPPSTHTQGLSLKITSPAFKSLAAKATLPTPSFESTKIAGLAAGKISIFLVNSEH